MNIHCHLLQGTVSHMIMEIVFICIEKSIIRSDCVTDGSGCRRDRNAEILCKRFQSAINISLD